MVPEWDLITIGKQLISAPGVGIKTYSLCFSVSVKLAMKLTILHLVYDCAVKGIVFLKGQTSHRMKYY